MNTAALKVEESLTETVSNSGDQRQVRLQNSTIMLVDDEPVMLEIVQALLEEVGYRHFVSVVDSTTAIDVLQSENPDMLLLDLDMPGVDGFEVLEKVRLIDGYEHLPVIILTASEDPDNKLKALELGATDFLSKPVDPSELALRVRNTLTAKAYQDQLAFYDSLTGLPNRKLFLDYLGKSISLAKREDKSLVLLVIGLDRFQQVNESLGVYLGDQILQIVADRLNSIVRNSDVVGRVDASTVVEDTARIGGDEFSIVIHGVNSVTDATVITDRVLTEIKKPISIDGEDVYLTASIGISVFPEDGVEVGTLLKRAGSAKDFAKKRGRDRYQYYSNEMEAHSRALMKMATDLRTALENDQFELHYQPKVDIRRKRVMGMECLIRWKHPDFGFISPEKFIPIAEESGLIVAIGDWVMREACHRTSEWHAMGYESLKVSVNVSANQFLEPDFKSKVVACLESSGMNPNNLVLEITESMLMGDVDQLANLLNDIKKLGVSFSLDDFGTGYSSLSYLKKFPIDELKIDRSFLIDVPGNEDDNSIAIAIIAMAHSLGQKVVAEGVEKIEQVKFLNHYKCDVIQGYFFSKPLSKENFQTYLGSKK